MLHSSDEAITQAVPTVRGWFQLARQLDTNGMHSGYTINLLKIKVNNLGLSTSHFIRGGENILIDDVLETVVRESTSLKQIRKKLGLSSLRNNEANTRLRKRIIELRLSTTHFRYPVQSINQKTRSTPRKPRPHQRSKIDEFDDDSIRTIVRDSISERIALRKFGYVMYIGSNQKIHLMRRLASLNIDTSHWKTRKVLQNSDLFVADKAWDSSILIPRLIKDFGWTYECRECKSNCSNCTRVDGVLMWRNKPMRLQLDHISGDHTDNRIENLRFLCANCHTLTPTFCGKNQKKAIATRVWLAGEADPESPA